MSKPISELTPADFEAHRGESFGLDVTDSRLELKLAEVRRLGTALRAGGAFSLLFLSAAGPFLPQAIYPMTHPALGTLEMFIVPLGPRDGENSYEAVFT